MRQSANDSRLETKHGGGCMSLFGLPFILAGLGVIVATFIPAHVRGGDEISFLFGIPFGGVFASVGAAFLFGRSGLILDKNENVIEKWWGLLVPMYRKTVTLTDIQKVTISRETRRSKNSSYTVYPIRLEGNRSETIKITEPRDTREARNTSEKYAKFLQLPIYDRSEGAQRIREPDTLDMSLKEQFQKGKTTNEIPEAPQNLKSKIEFDGSQLKVETPPAGLSGSFFGALITFLFFETILYYNFGRFAFEGDDTFGRYIALGITAFPVFVMMVYLASRFLFRQTLEVTRHQAQLSSYFVFTSTKSIPAIEIEELYIGSSGQQQSLKRSGRLPINVVSDKQRITFAKHLPQLETEYLLSLIKAILVSD